MGRTLAYTGPPCRLASLSAPPAPHPARSTPWFKVVVPGTEWPAGSHISNDFHHFHLRAQKLLDNVDKTVINAVHRYCRADLIRILRLTPRQLGAWEKTGLVPSNDSYSFFDLLQIKKVRDLCARKVRPAVIRQSLAAMQKQAAGMENPLLEAGTFTTGHRVAFRHDGKVLEPIAGQFMFDFVPSDNVVARNALSIAGAKVESRDVAELFTRGIALEENAATQTQAIAVYQMVLELDPEHAAAHINLGTLCYNRQDYRLAEKHYRIAIGIDPRYALAYFDLGNVLDETGRVGEAIQAYNTALQLAPTYGDAHYNLALAYEKIREPRKALKHWRAYAKLDAGGPWAIHARNQIKRILQADSLKLVPNHHSKS
jgi:tetratricopeptide (TPR) repeat protein